MKKVLLFAVAALMLAGLSGCMSFAGGIAPSNVPLEGKDYTILGPANGQDSTWYVFGIPLSTSSSTDRALTKAIKKRGADALINITSDAYLYNYIVVYRNVIRVHGQGIRFLSSK